MDTFKSQPLVTRPQSDGVVMPPPSFLPAASRALMCQWLYEVAWTDSQNE